MCSGCYHELLQLEFKNDSQVTRKLLSTLIALSYADIDKNLLAELNDSGMPFDEIADHLDKFGGSRKYR